MFFNRSGSPERFSRIVTLSSEAHIPGTINFEDLQSKYASFILHAAPRV